MQARRQWWYYGRILEDRSRRRLPARSIDDQPAKKMKVNIQSLTLTAPGDVYVGAGDSSVEYVQLGLDGGETFEYALVVQGAGPGVVQRRCFAAHLN